MPLDAAPGGRPVAPGAGVALLTLFDDNGALLADETAALAAEVVACGAASVLVCGTVGEFYTLTDEERITVFAAVRAAVPPDVPIIAHIGGVPEPRVAALASAAITHGADALIALAQSVEDVGAFYQRLVDLADGTPLLAYHLPAIGSVVPVAALAGLGVAGIKDSGTDAARLAAEIITTGVDTYTGTAYLLGLTHDLGGSGALLGLSNSHPELGVKALAGDEAALRSLIERSMGAASNFPGGLKQLAHERWGVPLGSRTPHGRTVMELIES